MEVPGFVTASPQDGISGISIVPFPELLSMFDAVEDGFDVFSFDSMFIGFSSIQKENQEHFTPQKHFDSAPSRLSLLLGFGISFARARRLRKIWGTLFHVSFPSLRPVISGLMGIFVLFNSKALNSRPYTRSY